MGKLWKAVTPVLPRRLPAEANSETWKTEGTSLTRSFVPHHCLSDHHQRFCSEKARDWFITCHLINSGPPKRTALGLSFQFLQGPLLASQGTLYSSTAFPQPSILKIQSKGLAITYRLSLLLFYRWEKRPGDGKPEVTKGDLQERLHQDSFPLQQRTCSRFVLAPSNDLFQLVSLLYKLFIDICNRENIQDRDRAKYTQENRDSKRKKIFLSYDSAPEATWGLSNTEGKVIPFFSSLLWLFSVV